MEILKIVSASEVAVAPQGGPNLFRLSTDSLMRGGKVLLVLLLYFGASQLAAALDWQATPIAFVRPAAGVLVGGLAITSSRDRGWLLAGAFPIAVLQAMADNHGFGTAIASAFAQVGEAAVVIAIYAYRGWPLQLGSPRQVCRFVGAIVIACSLTGLVAAPVLAGEGGLFSAWLRWLMADTIGIVATAPPFVVLKLPEQHRRITGEAVLAIACGAMMSALVFLTPPSAPSATQHLPVSLIFPFLLWCGARCSPLPNAILSFVVAMIAIASIAIGLGPFSSLTWPIARRLFAVQNLVLVVSAGTLLLSILFAERRDREAQLASALETKNALLYEVNHRVKNSLQLAISVLTIEATKLKDPQARSALQTAQSRIAIIAGLHRRLYLGERHATVQLDEVLEETARSVLGSAGRDDIALIASVERGLPIDIGAAVPIAVATAEIITNAVQHAYPDRGGPIHLELKRDRSALLLHVRDEGPGFSEMTQDDTDRVGMRIIHDLFRQLNAAVELESRAAGTSFVIRIPYEQSSIAEP